MSVSRVATDGVAAVKRNAGSRCHSFLGKERRAFGGP